MPRVSLKNGAKPAPKWFRKLRRVVLVTTGAVTTILMEDKAIDGELKARILVYTTLGIGAVLEVMQTILSDEPEKA